MHRVLAALVALAAGCFSPNPPTGLACTPAVGCPDGEVCQSGFCVPEGVGSDAIAPPACLWSPPPELVDPCFLPDPGVPIALGADTYDTDTDLLGSGASVGGVIVSRDDGEGEVRVIVADAIEIFGQFRVVGSRRLALVSYSNIAILGELDVGSGGGLEGAGAGGASCSSGLGGESSGSGGSGGGGGGGYGGTGGSGGPTAGINGVGGSPVARPFVGGCRGGAGGSSGMLFNGGPGGGAIYLAAFDNIDIQGGINAGGGGGLSGEVIGDGGGGGGSGGYIGLDAPDISSLPGSTLAANGGGGGSGGANGNGEDGLVGDVPARGGVAADGTSSDGGTGGAGVIVDGESAPTNINNGDSGGGGGAAGLIELYTANGAIPLLEGVVSPVPGIVQR